MFEFACPRQSNVAYPRRSGLLKHYNPHEISGVNGVRHQSRGVSRLSRCLQKIIPSNKWGLLVYLIFQRQHFLLKRGWISSTCLAMFKTPKALLSCLLWISSKSPCFYSCFSLLAAWYIAAPLVGLRFGTGQRPDALRVLAPGPYDGGREQRSTFQWFCTRPLLKSLKGILLWFVYFAVFCGYLFLFVYFCGLRVLVLNGTGDYILTMNIRSWIRRPNEKNRLAGNIESFYSKLPKKDVQMPNPSTAHNSFWKPFAKQKKTFKKKKNI